MKQFVATSKNKKRVAWKNLQKKNEPSEIMLSKALRVLINTASTYGRSSIIRWFVMDSAGIQTKSLSKNIF
jgi:hypothetical protein